MAMFNSYVSLPEGRFQTHTHEAGVSENDVQCIPHMLIAKNMKHPIFRQPHNG